MDYNLLMIISTLSIAGFGLSWSLSRIEKTLKKILDAETFSAKVLNEIWKIEKGKKE